jgi:myosin heavy subunit
MHKARKERAEIMEKQKKQAPKEKRVTSTSFNPTSAGKSEPIYYSPSNMEGMGLWCQPTQGRVAAKPSVPDTPEAFTKDVELKLSQEMSSMLEKKCSELGRKLDSESFSRNQAEQQKQILEKQVKDLQVEIVKYQKTCDLLESQKEELEKAMDENCIHYNYAENQIISLQKELENEKERVSAYQKILDEQTRLKEEEFEEYQHEIEYLKQTVEGANDENNGLKEYLAHVQAENEKLLQEKESLGIRIVQETHSNQTKEEKAKAKTTKINLLTAENKALQQKVKEFDENKKKSAEILKKKEEEVKSFKQEIELLKNRIKTEQDMRRHQVDLVAQRDARIRIFEEKYEKLENQFQTVCKKSQQVEEVKAKPKLVKVQANPDIFND